MNRTSHLQETLKINIESNISYGNVEFVILNYNSSDNLEEFVQDIFQYEIKNKIVRYFKTPDPKYFHMSHAKNSVARLSTGDIICNLDADNYTGNAFSDYINDIYTSNSNAYLIPSVRQKSTSVLGRVCLRREDFMSVEGYDEKMIGYGYEDIDLYNRLNLMGLQRLYITDSNFLQSIDHSSEIRYSNYELNSRLEKIFVSYLSPQQSILLLLYNDGHFERFLVFTDGIIYTEEIPGIDFSTLVKGEYVLNSNRIILNDVSYRYSNSKFSIGKNIYRGVIDQDYFYALKCKYSIVHNFNLLNFNQSSKIVKPNSGKFGVVNLSNL